MVDARWYYYYLRAGVDCGGGGIIIWGWYCCCGELQLICVDDCNRQSSRCLNRSRWQGVGQPGAWRLPIADLEDVVRTMVACRVGGGNDAAAMRVLRRDDRLPWLLFLATVEFVRE